MKTETKMNVRNGRVVENVTNVTMTDISVFIWLNDHTRIEVYAKDLSKLNYTRVV